MGIRLLKNKTTVVIAMIVLVIMAITAYKKFFYAPPMVAEAPLFEVKVYQPDSSGWAYRIYHKGQPFIQQEYVPAIAGQHRFKSKSDAEKTAEYVKQKLLKDESPTLSKAELHLLGIE